MSRFANVPPVTSPTQRISRENGEVMETAGIEPAQGSRRGERQSAAGLKPSVSTVPPGARVPRISHLSRRIRGFAGAKGGAFRRNEVRKEQKSLSKWATTGHEISHGSATTTEIGSGDGA